MQSHRLSARTRDCRVGSRQLVWCGVCDVVFNSFVCAYRLQHVIYPRHIHYLSHLIFIAFCVTIIGIAIVWGVAFSSTGV